MMRSKTAIALLLALATSGCLPAMPAAPAPATGGDMATPPPPTMDPPPQAPPAPTPTPTALASFQSSFYSVAVQMCSGCHNEKPNEGVLVPQNPLFASSNVEFAYTAAKPFVDFTTPANSLLVQYAGNNHCGIPAKCGSGSAAVLTGITAWIANDTPLAAPAVRNPVSDLQTLQLVSADLAAQPVAAQPYLRYFTLEYWGNTNGQPALVAVESERAALIKMLNLVSTGPQIVQPAPIDTANLIYRVDMRSLKWTAAAWTNLKATDPYFKATDFPTTLAAAANQTMRSDWFVFSIPNSAVNAYFVFLGINSDDPTIDGLNNVNRFADMQTGYPATVRAGFALSRTEAFNRIVSWHGTTTLGAGAVGSGHLFKSYNFDSDTGTADIFSHPYRPTTNLPSTSDMGAAPGPYDFDFADSDNVFTLPNGLFGYYTTIGAAAGQVQTAANAGAPFPGPTFCFQCHDNTTNLLPFVDQMNAAIKSSPLGTFPSTLQTLLLGMYNQTAMNSKIASAGDAFGKAYAQLKLPAMDIAGTPTGLGTEVMNVVTNNYSIVLQVGTAAAELGVSISQLTTVLAGSKTLASALASLLTTDASGSPNGVIRRDAWEANYAAVRKLLFPQL